MVRLRLENGALTVKIAGRSLKQAEPLQSSDVLKYL